MKVMRDHLPEPESSNAERSLGIAAGDMSPEERVDQLVRLEHKVNRALLDAENASGSLTAAMEAICESLGWHAARYWCPDETQTGMHLRQSWASVTGAPQETAPRTGVTELRSRGGLIEVARQTAKPVWAPDVREHESASDEDIARLSSYRSTLLIPARSNQGSIDVLELSAPQFPEPDEPLLHALGVLSARIANTYRRISEWEQLRENDECHNSTFELAAIGMSHVGDEGKFLHVNRQLCEMLGYSADELIGRTVEEISHPDDTHVTGKNRERLRSGEIESFTAEKRYIRKDGAPIWVRITAAARRDEDGKRMYDVSVVEDISERKAAEEELRASEEFYHSTFEQAAIGISHVAADGTLIHVNRQLCEMLGYSKDELVGRTVKEISHPDDMNVSDEDRAKLRAGEIEAFKLEKRYQRKDGAFIWVKITVTVKRAPDGAPLYDVSIVEDVSEQKAAEGRIEYLATHDEMTKLPNRAMFAQVLENAIQSAQSNDHQFSVLFIDLDRFKLINDSLGHDAGDELLKEMSSRFKACIRASDTVARLGGDEFVVLLQDVKDPDQVAVVARKLLSEALKPVRIAGQQCRVTASVGICTFPVDARDAQSLMKNADMAMYLAKEEGKNNFQVYSGAVNSQSIERLTLENGLRLALERSEFFVHYQPKQDMATGEIKGVEALLRWDSPEIGSVPPARFIPLAEEMGLIVPIGRWVLEAACAQNMSWQEQGLPPITMAVNLSPRQFRDPDLLQDVADVLEKTGMPPELLELEITEGMLMRDIDEAIKKLTVLKETGVRLSIDDFGTGYSSLAQLKRFPIDTLKVDRSFIRDLPNDAEDKGITEAIISMGRTLGVTVIAEGVETAEQRSYLKSRECDQIQGFYFSEPCDPTEFANRLKDHLSNSVKS